MLNLKFYYPHNSDGWRMWAGILKTGFAVSVSPSGEFAIELFCGELSIDYWAGDNQFYLQAAIGYPAWMGFGFDGQQFSLGGG
jgi:hypothetical protein